MKYASAALGSDIARSRKQAIARDIATLLVKMLGLNKPGPIATEIVQAVRPVARIETLHGSLLCRAGHGRLVWRARTFFTEEPDTIEWLDALGPKDVLWDVGANVGLYAIYAAKFRDCRVIAFEPESQNYALLIENMALNGIGERLDAICIALTDTAGFGHLAVASVTKGGAYNLFESPQELSQDPPESIRAARQFSSQQRLRQLTFGCSIDELVARHGFTPPTHIKIDVDGIEYKVIEGARRTLDSAGLKSILIELNEKSRQDQEIPRLLESHGFRLAKRRSVWDTKPDKSLQADMPAYNAIFTRSQS